MEAALLAFAGWLDAVGARQWASATPWIYPAANVLHVIGLAMLVGAIGAVDLRVVGFWRSLPLAALSRALTPIAVAGLLVQVVSGLVLFAADGMALALSWTFRAKLVLLAVALANVALFRLATRGGLGERPPAAARASAVLSLSLWLAIATLGRLIAYV